jgi:subtilisin family serine protease
VGKFTVAIVLFLIISSIVYAKPLEKVVIKFKDPSVNLDDLNITERLELKKESIDRFRNKILRKMDIDVEYKYNFTNVVIAYVDSSQLSSLKKNPNVQWVLEDFEVHAFLDSSVQMISPGPMMDLGINGSGETVCIIDTGTDYAHPSLGNCTIEYFSTQGSIFPYPNESVHPYTNYMGQVYRINYSGFDMIAVHFVNISTESEWDYVKILDGENNTIASYTGFIEDFWTPSVMGDTIYVKLDTDDSITDWGFKIDSVINGTYNTSIDWDSCSKVIGGWDFTGNQNDLDDQDPMDDEGHGTHVSGIIASTDSVYRGVAPGAKIVSVKALDETGSGNTTDVLAAMEYCLENSQRYNISVISMSLGSGVYGSHCDQNNGLFTIFSDIVKEANKAGIMVVAASGNTGQQGVAFPACLENVTSVGAVTDADEVAAYSETAQILDVYAPGTDIISVELGGTFIPYTGTSMATPHVAGAALLLRSFKKSENGSLLGPLYIDSVLKLTGDNRTDSYTNKNPRINITRALAYIDDMPRITFNDFLEGNTTENFTVINITLSESSDALIHIDHGLYNMSGLGRDYTFRINLTSLHNYSISITDSTGNQVNSIVYFLEKDATPPIITILYPQNNSRMNESHEIPFNFTVDIGTCVLQGENATDSSTNISIYENGQKNITLNCTEESGLSASSTIFLLINDTSSPSITNTVSSTVSTISFAVSSDEPSNISIMMGTQKVSGFAMSHSLSYSGLQQNTAYGYVMIYCDRLGNCAELAGSKSTLQRASSGGGSGSSGGGSGGYSYTLPKKTEEKSTSLFLKSSDPSVIVEETVLPDDIPSPEGLLFKVFKMTGNASDVSLDFSVNKTWVKDNDLDKGAIQLNRYHGVWQELPTRFKEEDEELLYFESETPGFSYFTITGKQVILEEKIEEKPIVPVLEEPTGNTVIADGNPRRHISYVPLIFIFVISMMIIYAIFSSNKK